MGQLLVATECENQVHLIIGLVPLSLTRISNSIKNGAKPILIAPRLSTTDGSESRLNGLVDDLVAEGNLQWIERSFTSNDLITLGRDEVNNVVDAVFVCVEKTPAILDFTINISKQCRKLRIPINVADNGELSTFTMLSTYADGSFKMGITTGGKGCRLATRIKRELAGSLPLQIGEICDKVGQLRKFIYEKDLKEFEDLNNNKLEIGQDDDDAIQTFNLNKLVIENEIEKHYLEKKRKRMRWLTQIVEYYPLNKLIDLSIEKLSDAYYNDENSKNELKEVEDKETEPSISSKPSIGAISSMTSITSTFIEKKGQISLVGSGPGSVSLLTIGALSAINSADLILADKLVPSEILSLIPKNTETFIARKFPGNAEAAQQELLSIGLEALKKGKKIVRLKQGDPYIFGRGAEEYNFFNEHGFKPIVIAGVTSALSAPIVANIPATHRQVADQVLICTGTGRKGALPDFPEHVVTRTTVFLMALHRIEKLINELVGIKKWDENLPCCVVERASCHDQRIIRTSLKNVVEAVEVLGSRPPGLLITGWACQVIEKKGQEGLKWTVEEGLGHRTVHGPDVNLLHVLSSI